MFMKAAAGLVKIPTISSFHVSNMADSSTHEKSKSIISTVNSDEPSVTCISCAELELELRKTHIELESTEKIAELLRKEIKLMAEGNVCCSLCANASSSEV
jgi:hypothetical protein